MNYLNAEDSAKWLAENKILLHPTEGVWGIGCNAKSSIAIDRIFDLKKRDKSKKFILLSPSIDSVKEFCLVLKEDVKILGFLRLLLKLSRTLSQNLLMGIKE